MMATEMPALSDIERRVLTEFLDPDEEQFTVTPVQLHEPRRYLARAELGGCLTLARLLHQQERLLIYRMSRFFALDAPTDYGQLLRAICRERLVSLNAVNGFRPDSA